MKEGKVRDLLRALEASERKLAKIRAMCDESEQMSKSIWDSMDDYADIGYPKGEWSGSFEISGNRVRDILNG